MPYKDAAKKRARSKEYWQERYKNKREQILANQKEYRKKEPNAKRNSAYKYVFGVDLEYVTQKLHSQEGKCSICSKPLNSSTGGTKPQLDHDHSTGMLRDLLCVRCNRVLGLVGDSVELLMKFVSYIQRHKEKPSGHVAKSWKRLNGGEALKTTPCLTQHN